MPPSAPAAPPTRRAPSGSRGPLRAGVAIFVAGFLVVWLVKPIGNPCPDLSRLPAGSSASSSPSFSPPGSRTCTYTAVGGTNATSKYMPWLDWIVLLLLAAVAGGAVRVLSPAGRLARGDRVGGEALPRGAERQPRAERPPRQEAPPRAEPPQRAEPSRRAARQSRAEPSSRAARDPSPPSSRERDAAERERARQERAARKRDRRGR